MASKVGQSKCCRSTEIQQPTLQTGHSLGCAHWKCWSINKCTNTSTYLALHLTWWLRRLNQNRNLRWSIYCDLVSISRFAVSMAIAALLLWCLSLQHIFFGIKTTLQFSHPPWCVFSLRFVWTRLRRFCKCPKRFAPPAARSPARKPKRFR